MFSFTRVAVATLVVVGLAQPALADQRETGTLPAPYVCTEGPFAALAALLGGECLMEFVDVEGSEIDVSSVPAPAAETVSSDDEDGSYDRPGRKHRKHYRKHRRHHRRQR